MTGKKLASNQPRRLRTLYSTTMSTAKQRHYAALSSRLRALKSNLAESEVQMEALSMRLQSMQKLAANHGAQ